MVSDEPGQFSLIQTAINLRPENPFCLDTMGFVLYKLKKYDQSLAILQKASELAPEIPKILEHKGDVYYRIGKYCE